MNDSTRVFNVVLALFITFLVVLVFGTAGGFSFPSLSIDSQAVSLSSIFLTGLLVGGLTCLAVQGGLLATTIAQREELKLEEKVKTNGAVLPITSFLIAKLFAYTILGFLFGWLGSLVQLSLTSQAILQFAVAIFMIGVAFNLLNIHPIFRYFLIQPPKFLTRRIRKQSKSSSIFAPAILGAFTVFIPCGTTQAMMALAIASGSPILGATILFVFILGTSPLFFLLGYFATKLGDVFQRRFLKVAALAIILLALYNMDGALGLMGSSVSVRNLFAREKVSAQTQAVEEATIEFKELAYSPGSITVKAGSHVKLNLVNSGGKGCIQAFTIPKLGVQKIVPIGTSNVVEFTAPQETGQIAFMCSMGMYRGVINII